MWDKTYKNDSSGILLDEIVSTHKLKNDAALSKFLAIKPAVISKYRHGKSLLTPAAILQIHDKTGLSINEIRRLIGIKK